jgi:hypothetical protein
VKTNYKEMNMKNSLKLVLLAAGAVLATSVARADSTASQILFNETTLNQAITVSTDVSDSGGLYTYTYSVSAIGGTPLDLDSFTVHDLVGTVVSGSEEVAPTPSEGSWSGNQNGEQVAWTFTPTSDPLPELTLTFSFTSYEPPIAGTSSANDGAAYGANAHPVIGDEVLVPGPSVPDGGLTVALLGGAMTAMTLIRRKLV